MMDQKAFYWVPSLYFFQSIPFALVSLISLILYQQKGFTNSETILLTSLFMLPWSLKLLIVPFLETRRAKKKILVSLQMMSALLCFILALALHKTYFFPLSAVVFSLLALMSSAHDMVADALYLTELDPKTQKNYVGVRTIFYQLGILFVKGGLLAVLPSLALYYHLNSWGLFFVCVGGVVSLLALYHHFQLPYVEVKTALSVPIKQVIHNVYDFTQKHFGALIFVFFYNVSTAPMQKILPLFLLDAQELNLSLSQVGTMYGVWGMSFFLLGVFISGHLISRFSLIHTIKWFTLLLALGYCFFMTLVFCNVSMTWLFLALLVNQFFTGLANGAYMGYLLTLSNKSQNPMSAYTLCTSLMALSCIFFGFLTGIALNYIPFKSFFLFFFIATSALTGLIFAKGNSYE